MRQDAPFSYDKFGHYAVALWVTLLVALFVGDLNAAWIVMLGGALWELKDGYAPELVLSWPWLVRLFGSPFNLGGSGLFSIYDLAWDVAGILTAVILKGCP